MANTRSQLITNAIATPRAYNPVGESEGVARVNICRFSTVAGDGVGHLYRLCLMDATDRIFDARRVNTADAGMTTVDIGIYTPSGSSTVDPIAIDADGLCVDFDASAASAIVGSSLVGLGITAQADFGKALWEWVPGGPATQPTPGTKYEIVLSPGGNPAGGGDYTIFIYYVAGA